jgi:AraC-like DNA-binding protein
VNHQYLIKSNALAGYTHLVRVLGGNPEELVNACNLSKSDLQTQDNFIPFSSMVELLEHSAEKLNAPDFGLQLGQSQGIEALGNLGLLIGNCNNVREALKTAQHYMAVHSQAEYWRFKEMGQLACIERFSVMPPLSHVRQIKELSFATGFTLLKTLINQAVKLDRVEFAHAPISELSVYKKHFGCEVLFNQEYDRILLPLHYLDSAIWKITLEDNKQLESQLANQLAENDHDIERQITIIILQIIGSQEISIDVIADILKTHKRTLQRRLKAKGLSFSTILKEIRVNTACWHLEASTIDITLLGEILGYSDVSAFSRAFKKETLLSPLQWRKEKRENFADNNLK